MHTSVVPSPALSHRSDFELTGECRSTNNSSGGLSCAKPSCSPRSFSCSLWERAMPRLRRLAGVRSIMSAARGSTVARNACRNVTTTSARAINARWFWWVERRHKGQRQGLPRSLRGPNIPAGESRRRRIRRRTERRRAGVIDDAGTRPLGAVKFKNSELVVVRPSCSLSALPSIPQGARRVLSPPPSPFVLGMLGRAKAETE